MIVVSDTTPLITLMKANKLSILENLFEDVLIPEAVFAEVTANQTFQNEADFIRNSSYIQVVKVADPERASFLRRATGLGIGESEAIIYADEVKADMLLMDELAGRKVALNMSLPVTGSIGILIKAFQSRLIAASEAEDALWKIRKANRHISVKLIDKALDIIHCAKMPPH